MSSTDERRHVARRLAEHDVAIDLEPYDQESVSGQDLIAGESPTHDPCTWIRRRWSCRMTPAIVEPALRCYHHHHHLRERCR
ncbi:MAG TPA: hypothetical protein VIJ00_10480 [Nakamurella sp.]